MMIEAIDFRNAMSLLSSAVNVVTTAGMSGRYGFTASAVCGVSDSPATLLVCMNRAASSHIHFIENKILSVNVLAEHQQHLSTAFSSKISPEERFKQAIWTELETGSPILTDALVSFDCEIEQIQEVGTHSIFICRIVAIQQSQQEQGLVYFNRVYHHVGQVDKHLTAVPINHSTSVDKAFCHRDICYIRCPHLITPLNTQSFEQIWIFKLSLIGLTWIWFTI